MDISIWILIVYCFLFPLFQIRRPDILATCSFLANILTLVGTITIFVYIFSVRTFQTQKKNWRAENEVHWTKLPLTMGITFYAYQMVAPLVSIQHLYIRVIVLFARASLVKFLLMKVP
jgi:amino acid permease